MTNLGVRFGCINYEYIYSRTPRFNLEEECVLFEDLMATPGKLIGYPLDYYQEWLNEHAELFSFALSPYPLDDCAVNILPYDTGHEYYISYNTLRKPFARTKYKKAAEEGDIIHGLEAEEPYMVSMNSGLWMRGKGGAISHFDKRNRIMVHTDRFTRTAFARELVVEGYDLDLNKIKREEWKEVAKLNCIEWKKYQDYVEVRDYQTNRF
jgi:hypothetical protein